MIRFRNTFEQGPEPAKLCQKDQNSEFRRTGSFGAAGAPNFLRTFSNLTSYILKKLVPILSTCKVSTSTFPLSHAFKSALPLSHAKYAT